MILGEIVECLRQGIVHADLSEYNVFLDEGGIKIIDWPQAISSNHPNAEEMLDRDVGNILKFFLRRFGIDRSLDATLERIREEGSGVRS